MALAYDDSRLTRDVDAVFEPMSTVRDLTEELARRHGLEGDWINHAAKGFLPGEDANRSTVFESDSLLVQVASPEYLLAMKLQSGRAGRDIDDAVKLYGVVGYTSPEQAHALLQQRYPQAQLLPRHRYIVEDVAAQASEIRQQADPGMTAARAAFPGTARDAVRAPGAPQTDPAAARGSRGHERGTGTQR